jgi:hypothetical protein
MKTTQAEAAKGRLSEPVPKREPGVISQVLTKLAHQLIAIGKSILAFVKKDTALNS